MPPPNNPEAGKMCDIMFAEQQRRYAGGATMDRYPASASDLIWCAIALLKAGYKKAPVETQGLPCGCHCKGGCGDPYAACMHPCSEHVPF